LALTDNASLNSSGGTITLGSGASAPSGTSISLPDTTLVLQNALSLTGATLKTKNTTFTTNANALTLSGGILEVEGTQNLGGVFPDNSTTLRLAANSTISDNASLSIDITDNLPGSAFTAVGNYSSSSTVDNAFDGSTSTKYLNTGAGSGVIINAGAAYIVDTLGLTTANDVDHLYHFRHHP